MPTTTAHTTLRYFKALGDNTYIHYDTVAKQVVLTQGSTVPYENGTVCLTTNTLASFQHYIANLSAKLGAL